jgi:ribosomal protein L37AE/L43A
MRVANPHRFARKCPRCGSSMVKRGYNTYKKQIWVCRNKHQTVHPIVERPIEVDGAIIERPVDVK